jgi:hypothetical protein
VSSVGFFVFLLLMRRGRVCEIDGYENKPSNKAKLMRRGCSAGAGSNQSVA